MMNVTSKSILPNGVDIQIEDWSKDYSCFNENDTIAIYPVSKVNIDGYFAPRKGEKFRCEFRFKNEEDAKKAYEELVNGSKKPIDFKDFLMKPEYSECL